MLASSPTARKAFDRRRLSNHEIDDLRKKWVSGEYTPKQLSERFGISQSYTNQLIHNKRRVMTAVSFKREFGLDGSWHIFLYTASGEQLKEAESEEVARAEIGETALAQRRLALAAEQRALEKRLREVNNELADLEGLPF